MKDNDNLFDAFRAPNAIGFARYHYCLMQKDGVYQWRWQDPMPPEATSPEISPRFDSIDAAMKWHKSTVTTGVLEFHPTNEGWQKVEP